ncbi:hypothetical protein Anas_04744 [Armadillidium nasatum]|uniref:Uncharacterized protein n=1 Tax=Armadillidium nasatum TaxID=96803 RepID=A0A5N5TPR9_9CRUS|nr:hypothetical protein Anas_04744 [Armadillidium nasatum]
MYMVLFLDSLVYGQIFTRILVLCDLTSVLYIQNFVPSLQIGNLKEKGSKPILTLKDKVPPFLALSKNTIMLLVVTDLLYIYIERLNIDVKTEIEWFDDLYLLRVSPQAP